MCRIPILIILLLICTINGALGGCGDYPVALAPKLLESNKVASKTLKIGAFGSFTVIPTSVPLLHFAVNIINNQTDILPDTYIELYVAQLNRSSSNALLASQALINTYNVTALIGGLYSSETRVGQLVSRIYSVPEVAATPLSTLLSNKIEYPYLARVIPPDQYEAQAIADMFARYGWMQALVFYCDDEFGTYGMSNMVQYTKDRNVTLYSSLITTGATDFSSHVAFADNVVKTHNVKIIVMYTQATEANLLLNQLQAVGLTNGDFVYIHTFGAALAYLNTKIPPTTAFLGGLAVTPRGGIPGAVRDKFTALWEQYGTTIPNAQPDFGSAWYYVDAVYIIAHAVDDLLKSGTPFEQAHGAKLLKAISDINFTGVTGQVVLDDTNDRLGDYVWYKIGNNGIDLADILAVYDPIVKDTTILQTISINGKVNITDGWCLCFNGKCVDEVCVCNKGFSGHTCVEKDGDDSLSTAVLATIIVVPVVLVGLVVGGAIKYNQYKRKRMIKDISDRQRSVIKRSDIVLKDRIGRGASGEVFCGMMRGTDVAVKKLVTTAVSNEVISDFELECAIMAGLRHPNIVLFMGSCIVPEEREMLLVMELMERGSLHDIIHNPKVPLSRDLLLHVAYQSAKGMNFLHQSAPPIIHRDLKSHNILMDDKWNARISDFGITKIKSLSNKKSKEIHDVKQKTQSLGTIYWTAPEVFEGHVHTEASDVYSFGIVLWEMFHRQTPYGGREPMAVTVDVSNNVRPKLDPNLDDDVRDLMKECWSGTPVARPTFEQISTRLRGMMKTNAQHFTKDAQVEAPCGTVYFVFTEIDGAGDLWDEIPMTMLKSIELHNTFIRSTMERCAGYEVDFKDNGFFVTFASLQDAMNFCIGVQKGLLHVDWPSELNKHPAAKVVMQSGLPVWSGLRVRMGLHSGVSNCEIDRSSGRTTYFGPVVDRARKLLTATQKSYSIVTTAAVIDHYTKKGLHFSEEITHANCGEMLDTARSKTEGIYKVLPISLAARERASTVSDLPHSIVMVDVDTETDGGNEAQLSSRSTGSFKGKARAKWDIPLEHLDEKEKVGRGATGDYVRCLWQGQQVSSKVLLNQKIEEADMLILKARASVLSKLQHKNLLQFYGVCMEQGNIAVIVDFMPNAGLPALLADSSFSLNFKQKVSLVRQIAEGMHHLSDQEHEWVPVFALKSPNVLVDRTKLEVKLCDYGQGNLRDLARTMTSVGTVAWTAPEILQGDEANSAKSTTYSFAIIMWEIMHRQAPYQDQHPIKVVSKIMGGYRPPFIVDCPAAYSELAEACWDADPTKRPSWGSILSTLDTMV